MRRKSSALVATTNGNGNGDHARTYGVRQLQQMYALHTRNAEALRIVLGLLDDGATERRNMRGDSVIVEAVRLDEARRQALPPAAKRKSTYSDWSKGAVKKRRTQTLKKLGKISTDASNPTTRLGKGMQPMQRHGYIKKVPGGFVRTDKVFAP